MKWTGIILSLFIATILLSGCSRTVVDGSHFIGVPIYLGGGADAPDRRIFATRTTDSLSRVESFFQGYFERANGWERLDYEKDGESGVVWFRENEGVAVTLKVDTATQEVMVGYTLTNQRAHFLKELKRSRVSPAV